MKRILFFSISLFVVFATFANDSLAVDSLRNAKDTAVSIATHKEFSTANQLKNITKLEGDNAYRRNDYASAIQIYESLLRHGESADIYYNLGNSYYKSDNIAMAILNYERALLLKPGDADIRANLEVARAKTIDKVVAVPEIFFVSWMKSLINTMSVDAWARTGVVCFILLLVSLYFFFFSKQSKWKRIGFYSGILFLLFSFLANYFAFYQKSNLINRNDAIVLTPSVTVRSTPSEDGTSLFILHEGCKVEIKDKTMREWKEVQLADGKVGWIPASSIEVI